MSLETPISATRAAAVLARFLTIVVLASSGCSLPGSHASREDARAGRCGDGIIDPGETCDDGNDVDWDGCTACTISEFRVSSESLDFAIRPRVAMDQGGELVVVWWGSPQDHLEGRVRVRRLDARGRALGPELLVEAPPGAEEGFAAAGMTANGRTVMVWERSTTDATEYEVYRLLLDAQLEPEGPAQRVSSALRPSSHSPDVAVAADGKHVVVWIQSESPANYLYLRHFDADGSPVDEEQLLEPGGCGSPRVAMADDGRTVVAFVGWGWDGWQGGIYAKWDEGAGFFPTGHSSMLVNRQTEYNQGSPDVAMSPEGNTIVVWASDVDETELPDIRSCQWSATWDVGLCDVTVNPHRASGQWFPAVAMRGGASSVTVWSNDGEAGGGIEGLWSGPVGVGSFRPTTMPEPQTYTPDVTASPDGHFVVVWASLSSELARNGIFAQRFDASGQPLGHE